MAMVKLNSNGELQWYKQFGYGTEPLKAGDTDVDGILGLSVAPSGDITIAGLIKSGGKIGDKTVSGEGFGDMVSFIAGFSSDGNVGDINTFVPGKSGLVPAGAYKSDAQGRLLSYINTLKPFEYGDNKIKDSGIYRFSNNGGMELITNVSSNDLQGYIILPWDYTQIGDTDVMTIGTLTTPANIDASSAVAKYWEKTYKKPKGNPETGVVYSLYSK